MLARKAMSRAKNIESAPTRTPVRARRSSLGIIAILYSSHMARYAAVSPSLPPLTADDLAAFAFVNEAVISPDGGRVAYAVRRMDLEANRYRAAIQVGPSDGRAPAQAWTEGSAEDGSPRWSPDGTQLAFIADRGDVPQGKKRAPKNVFVVGGP